MSRWMSRLTTEVGSVIRELTDDPIRCVSVRLVSMPLVDRFEDGSYFAIIREISRLGRAACIIGEVSDLE